MCQWTEPLIRWSSNTDRVQQLFPRSTETPPHRAHTHNDKVNQPKNSEIYSTLTLLLTNCWSCRPVSSSASALSAVRSTDPPSHHALTSGRTTEPKIVLAKRVHSSIIWKIIWGTTRHQFSELFFLSLRLKSQFCLNSEFWILTNKKESESKAGILKSGPKPLP